MPRADDLPDIDFAYEEIPCKTNPMGANGCGEAATRQAGDITMIVVPAGVKVHLALGRTDMRKGLDGLLR